MEKRRLDHMKQGNYEMKKLILRKTILAHLLCMIALSNSHGMETQNTATPTQLLKESHVIADWDFVGAKEVPGIFRTKGGLSKNSDKLESIKVLQINNESLRCEQTNESTLISIPCMKGCSLIIYHNRSDFNDLSYPTERGIKILMNSEAQIVRSFSAPIVSIKNEVLEFDLNFKGDENSTVSNFHKAITKPMVDGLNKTLFEAITIPIKINSPFTFAFINSANKILVQGGVINANGMMDILGRKINVIADKTINDVNVLEDCECVMF